MKTKNHDGIIGTLRERFANNMGRHAGIEWDQVMATLEAKPAKIEALHGMESTGGEPDLIGRDEKTGGFIFCDCSAESPIGRRGLCYDREAFESRKEHKPAGNALETATSMGIEMLTEAQYRRLQELGEFDLKTSSWIETPAGVRALGGALFCDRRYGQVFTYHNGAESYYASRGFRGRLLV